MRALRATVAVGFSASWSSAERSSRKHEPLRYGQLHAQRVTFDYEYEQYNLTKVSALGGR